MAKSLIITKFADASRSRSFSELWHNLTNDQLFDLRTIFCFAFGHELDPHFTDATPEDWSAMANLIAILGSSVARVNSVISSIDWDNDIEMYATLTQLQRQAMKESPESLAVMEYLITEVKQYCALGGDDGSDTSLLEFRTVPPPLVLDQSSYDIFISYKTARHAMQAARINDGLTALGYRVWFDKEILTKMQNRPEEFEKEHLISILTNAIHRSRCTVIFEGVMQAIALPPGYPEEQSLADRTTIRGRDTSLLAWDWHVLEIETTRRGISIHPRSITAFRSEKGTTLWSRSFPYDDDQQLLETIKVAFELFRLDLGEAG